MGLLVEITGFVSFVYIYSLWFGGARNSGNVPGAGKTRGGAGNS